MQSPGQVICGAVTLPMPASVTSRLYWLIVKVAVTSFAWSIVTSHAPLPVHAPPQLMNVQPGSAVAVSPTITPWL